MQHRELPFGVTSRQALPSTRLEVPSSGTLPSTCLEVFPAGRCPLSMDKRPCCKTERWHRDAHYMCNALGWRYHRAMGSTTKQYLGEKGFGRRTGCLFHPTHMCSKRGPLSFHLSGENIALRMLCATGFLTLPRQGRCTVRFAGVYFISLDACEPLTDASRGVVVTWWPDKTITIP